MLDLLRPLHVSTVSVLSFLGLFFNVLVFHFSYVHFVFVYLKLCFLA
jgi:hypothetical protein